MQIKSSKETALFKYIAALICIKLEVDNFLKELHPSEWGAPEKKLAAMCADETLHNNSPSDVLAILEGALDLWLPGRDIAATGVGFVRNEEKGQKAIGIKLSLSPEKSVLCFMDRQLAEIFEKKLKENMDQHFGRIILP